MPSGGSSGSTTTQTEPWGGAKPYLKDIYTGAQSLYQNNPLTPYGGTDAATRQQNALQAFGGVSPTQLEQMYGLPSGSLSGAITTGVVGPTGATQQAEGLANTIGNSPISPLYGQASGATGGVLSNPGGIYGNASGLYNLATLTGQDPTSQYLQDAASGQYLNANPYSDAAFNSMSRPILDQFSRQVLPGISAQFAAGGRYGSGAQSSAIGNATDALEQNLTGMASQFYGGQYNNERQLQQQAATSLGGLGQAAAGQLQGLQGLLNQNQLGAAALTPNVAEGSTNALANRANILSGLGQTQEGQIGQYLNQALGTYGGVQQAPYNTLQAYEQFVAGNPASQLTGQTTPYYTNPTAGALGGALSGGALGASLGGPWGAAAGAGLGGLLGLFG